jgi:hypothetical protein
VGTLAGQAIALALVLGSYFSRAATIVGDELAEAWRPKARYPAIGGLSAGESAGREIRTRSRAHQSEVIERQRPEVSGRCPVEDFLVR